MVRRSKVSKLRWTSPPEAERSRRILSSLARSTAVLAILCACTEVPDAPVPDAPTEGAGSYGVPSPTSSGGETVAGARGVPLPTLSGDFTHDALVRGVLQGDASVDGGCLWVQRVADGSLISVRWPQGFSASFEPGRLLDADGRVVAQVGDLLALTGSPRLGDAELDRCDVGDEYWGASVVTVAEASAERP